METLAFITWLTFLPTGILLVKNNNNKKFNPFLKEQKV